MDIVMYGAVSGSFLENNAIEMFSGYSLWLGWGHMPGIVKGIYKKKSLFQMQDMKKVVLNFNP